MKKIIASIIVIFITGVSYAQTLSQKIANIRTEVQKINIISGYKITTLSNEQFLDEMPDGGGELQGYYKNGELMKIVEKIYLSSCVNITEYYLKNDKLIFAYTQGKEWAFNEQLNKFDPKRVALKMECRFYIENSKIINSIFKGKTRCSEAPNPNWSKNYIDNFNLWKNKLKEK